MERVRFPRSMKIYIPLLVLFVVLFLLLPRGGKFAYDYRKASPWMYDNLVTDFDFPVLKTDEMIQEEMDRIGENIAPCYRYSQERTDLVLDALKKLETKFSDTEGADSLSLAIEELSRMYSVGVLPDFTSAQRDMMIIIQHGKNTDRVTASMYKTESEARNFLMAFVSDASELDQIIKPNLIFDKTATELFRRKAYEMISTTSGVVPAGTTIIRRGDIVTAEHKQLLDSYKAEFIRSVSYNGPVSLMWLGNALMAFIIVLLLFLSICYGNASVMESQNRYLYLLFIFLISAVTTLCVDRFAPEAIFYIPYSLIAIYLLAFFRKRVVMPAYIMSLIPLLMFAHGGQALFMMHLVAGMVCIFSFSYFNKGWLQFVNSIFVFISLFIVWTTFKLINGEAHIIEYRTIVKIFIGSILCWLGYPMVYLFEKVFDLVSNSRLEDLCDTNTRLLRELAQKAPGTFQHCLQVMNLSDAAARSIGANVLLTRAGALYHDIGKMENPLCFVENQTAGVNYHAELSPEESARDIIKHVSDGMILADKFRLPDVVKQFIVTHHGTTSASYFLTNYLNAGGDPDKTDVFYYKGVLPKTKEQTIVMICDTLEAASRTLNDFSAETVSNFVEKIFASKHRDGQFRDSELTQRELGILKESLAEYIGSMHHARIVYPKQRRRAARS